MKNAADKEQKKSLVSVGTATQLIVDNQPFLVLGGELGNSSASSLEDIERIFPKLQRMGLNTALVPACWELIEPVQGKFDFSLIDKAIAQARVNGLKVVFLWFGTWKNSMSCYAPMWFKEDYNTYPRAVTKAGKQLEIGSSFSENILQADNRAFSQLMRHIASLNKTEKTVIMMQIENEIGMLDDARDYSDEANSFFNADVPVSLMKYLNSNKDTLHPFMLKKWGERGFKTQGTWREIFGDDVYTDEIFMAWSYAQFVETLAQSARAILDVPLFVNAAMNSRGRKPGEYPSAGPLAHLIDIWHCYAPSIDFLAPDLYDKGFADWTAQYKLRNNPLFIPEAKLTQACGAQAFFVFGEHDAIGYSPFSIEDGSDSPDAPLVQAYSKLRELAPILTKYQGKGLSKGLLFDEENKERILLFDDLTITCRHFFTLPWDPRAADGSAWPVAGGLILRLEKDDFFVAGSGIVIDFKKREEAKITEEQLLGEDGFAAEGNAVQKQQPWSGISRAGIGYVDEIKVNADGSFSRIRRLNGDQTHQGRHVRIGVDAFSILRVKLYTY